MIPVSRRRQSLLSLVSVSDPPFYRIRSGAIPPVSNPQDE
jgi:hypothetical protein